MGLPGLTRVQADKRYAGSTRASLLQVVATRPNNYTLGLSGTTSTSTTGKTAHVATCDITSLVLVYGNWFGNNGGAANGAAAGEQADGVSTLTVRGSIELSSGAIHRAWFNGSRTLTLEPGGIGRTEAIPVLIPKGTKFYIRTYVSVPASGQWPIGLVVNLAKHGEGDVIGDGNTTDTNEAPGNGTNGVDATASGAMSTGWGYAYSPYAILGTTSSGPVSSVALIGDSIINDSYDLQGLGFAVRALGRQYGYVRMSQPGENSSQATKTASIEGRWKLLPYCTHAWIGEGTNDVNQAVSAATMKTQLLALWSALSGRGIKSTQFTLLPISSSPNAGWTTLADQTATNPTIRSAVNQWLRAGAPIQAGAPVAIGTSGATLCTVYDKTGALAVTGTGGHPLRAVVDTGGVLESATDSGLWAVSAGMRTVTDGAMTSGSATLTSATANFTAADVDRAVMVAGAGTAGAIKGAVISSVANSTTVTLGSTAATTVSGASTSIGVATRDGVHPFPDQHVQLAAIIPTAALLA